VRPVASNIAKLPEKEAAPNSPLLADRWFESGPGSHPQIFPLISHRFFSFLANLEASLPLDVRALTFSIAAAASRF
jgi:hypothetical protein